MKWTSKALSDLARLYDFLAPVNKRAAARTVQALAAAPAGLRANPRIGEKLEACAPREVRRILVGKYEIRYEIQESAIYVQGFPVLAITTRHVEATRRFGQAISDPFDRLLLATAAEEGMLLLTQDTAILEIAGRTRLPIAEITA